MFIYNNLSQEIQAIYVAAEKCCKETKTWIAAHRAFSEIAASFVFNCTLIRVFGVPSLLPTALIHLIFCSVISCFKSEAGEHAARTSSAYFIGRAGIQTAIHESGHAAMALCCFKKADPIITILPFKNGLTTYAVSYGQTAFGKLLGKEASKLLIASSGIAASALFAMAAFAVADRFEQKYPAAKWLKYQGAAHLLTELYYSQKALYWSHENIEHDLIYLWQYGRIHPLIPISLLTALSLAALLRQE